MELVVRQAKDTAGALFHSISINHFSVSESANLVAQLPLRRSRIEKHIAVIEAGSRAALAAENLQAEWVGAIDPFDVEVGLAVVEAVDTHEQIFLVRFDFDSVELDENSLTTIRRAIDAIQDRFEGVAIVAGYSDPYGSTAYNLELSRKRAQAVADSLVALGVSGDRLRVEGRGTYAASDVKANEEPLELGRIAQIIIEESSKW